MGIESKDIEQSPVEALFGVIHKKILPYPEKTVFKFYTGCLNDDAVRLECERLLTKSFLCQNELEKTGDLAVLDMQGTFDKQGAYHIVLRYAYLTEDVKKEKI